MTEPVVPTTEPHECVKVPSEAPSISLAIELAQKRGSRGVIINLDAEFTEPRQAWPLDLEVSADSSIQHLSVVGPPGRNATIFDVALRTSLSACSNASVEGVVMLTGVTVRGQVQLSGKGCILEDCTVHHGIEVDSTGANAIRRCTVNSGRIGIAVHGAITLEETEISSCSVGVCLYGNPLALLRQNKLSHNTVAAVVIHCSMAAEEGSRLRLAPVIESTNEIEDCTRDFEIHVEIDGASPLVLGVLPFPEAEHSVTRPRGGCIMLKTENNNTLQVVSADIPARKAKKNKRRKHENDVHDKAIEPSWALDVLGLTEAGCGLTMKQLQHAYRCKAREVHPDKHPCHASGTNGSQVAEVNAPCAGDGAAFHRVTAAYEALADSLRSAKKRRPAITAQRHGSDK